MNLLLHLEKMHLICKLFLILTTSQNFLLLIAPVITEERGLEKFEINIIFFKSIKIAKIRHCLQIVDIIIFNI